jgi:hypothetical protein
LQVGLVIQRARRLADETGVRSIANGVTSKKPQRLAVVRQLETPADCPAASSRRRCMGRAGGSAHVTGKLAHMHAAAREGREHPEPVRVGQGRERAVAVKDR